MEKILYSVSRANLPLTPYGRWLKKEGIPNVTGYGVDDLYSLELKPWPRLGGFGAYINLEGAQGLDNAYVCEIAPGGKLAPERHMFEEIFYVLSGRGATSFWTDEKNKQTFEWQAGSLFAVPLNARHQLFNGSGDAPARLVAVTTAPLMMDLFHDEDFIFDNDYSRGWALKPGDVSFTAGLGGAEMWDTLFIPDVIKAVESRPVRHARGDELMKGAAFFNLGDNVLGVHITQGDPRTYHAAHHHYGGAHIIVLSETYGFTLIWPKEAGIRPFSQGNGDAVVRIDWERGHMFSPPEGWFHQHFMTGGETFQKLAILWGYKHPLSINVCKFGDTSNLRKKLQDGGTVIGRDDEDPQIKRMFAEALAKSDKRL